MTEAISEENLSEAIYFTPDETSVGNTKSVGIALEVLENAPNPSYYSLLKYEVSLAYTQFTASDKWWSKIEPLNLYLGALPLKNMGHLESIAELGVTDILAIVEDFELEDGWFNSPVKEGDWEAYGISIKQIPAVDFSPLTREEIKEGIESLHTLLEDEKTVYIHCKAGRGRSATIVIAYLMEHLGFTFQQAFGYVQASRPQINLNAGQRQAIFDYFSICTEELDEMNKDQGYISIQVLTNLLNSMLNYVIHGGSFSAEGSVPDALAAWVPSVEIQSTLERRDRYLREHRGDQEKAIEAAIARNHGFVRNFKKYALGAIPVVGAPSYYTISLWYQLREIALIAALHGHDLENPEVQNKMLSCLVGGNLLKVPAQSVDFVARKILNEAAKQTLGTAFPTALPAHLIFNYFTDNSAKVSTHAKEVFGGENSLPISVEDYA
ncbi:MAG: dual specificity protein phosphatase family protein [Simkania sp.]|nr:dual specificity protein phosphatase family protein [Simkania sp.]